MKTVYNVSVIDDQDIDVSLRKDYQRVVISDDQNIDVSIRRDAQKVVVAEDPSINVSLRENSQNINATLDVDVMKQPRSDYDGPYRVTPLAFSEIELDTNGKTLRDDIIIERVPYYETSNVSGMTIYIA